MLPEKFCLSKKELDDKLDSLGPDILDATTTEEIFLDVLKSLRSDWNICKLLMDQSVRRDKILLS